MSGKTHKFRLQSLHEKLNRGTFIDIDASEAVLYSQAIEAACEELRWATEQLARIEERNKTLQEHYREKAERLKRFENGEITSDWLMPRKRESK